MEIYLKCKGCGNPLLKVTMTQLKWLCLHCYGSRFDKHYTIQIVRKPKLERSYIQVTKWLKWNGFEYEEITDYSQK